MEIPAMNGVQWSAIEIDIMKEMYAEKVSPEGIAKALARTRDSVRTHASRLQLTGKAGTNRTYRKARGELKYREIITIVERYFGMGPRDMTSKRRVQSISWPRQIAMTMGVEFTNLSLPKLASYFDVDHTSVFHGNRRVPERCRVDAGKRAKVNTIRKIISDACCSRVAERMCELAWDELESHSAGA